MVPNVSLRRGDCLEVLAGMEPNSLDACVTDPPYHLTSGNAVDDLAKTGAGNPRQRRGSKGGFMGKTWDGGDIAFRPETWAAVLRALKPGAHLVAFGAPRNYHRLACAIEDAGFEIRDSLMWLFGSGFPKSHNVAVGIDKASGLPPRGRAFNMKGRGERADEFDTNGREHLPPYAPATDAAREWQGWGTALKPAYEPIILARKPLIGTVAANVLAHGTGAINVDGCRVGSAPGDYASGGRNDVTGTGWGHRDSTRTEQHALGRWPANIVHDGSDEVLAGFPITKSGALSPANNVKASTGWSGGSRADRVKSTFEPNEGSAARFFYCAKASAKDRAGSKHPTVKPVALMRWLCRLVTPPGGLILDPFAGSGTTGQAAQEEGFDAILIEREPEYQADIMRRIEAAAARPRVEVQEAFL